MNSIESQESVRVVKFLNECLRDAPEVAPLNLIMDSQTRQLMDRLETLGAGLKVLDYGCGQLRLLNALIEDDRLEDWMYLGADVQDPRLLHPRSVSQLERKVSSERWNICAISDLTSRGETHDVVVVMNVVHEVSLMEIAELLTSVRRLLKPDGRLLVIDTIAVPEGEPRFVPFYPWEYLALFDSFDDMSYRSKSGIPIAFYEIPRAALPCPHGLSARIASLYLRKRDALAQLAEALTRDTHLEERELLGLGQSLLFDLAYVNAVVSNTTFRIAEYKQRSAAVPDIDWAVLGRCVSHLIAYVDDYFFGQDSHELPSVADVYDALGTDFSVETIESVLTLLQREWILFSIPPLTCDSQIMPSERWDMLCRYDSRRLLAGELPSILGEIGLYFHEL